MAADNEIKLTKIADISYFHPEPDAVLTARDGKVGIPIGDLPIPLLLNEDLSTGEPSYDAVGRGVYHLLRANPDAVFADRYAALLKDAYPHLLAELATNLVMLDKKDVDLPYLDRKIACLKIFSLLEPENPRFPLEIGATFFDKGMTLAAFGNTTMHLFSAEKFLRKALTLSPADAQAGHLLGEVCYLLGKYEDTLDLWAACEGILPREVAEKVSRIVAAISAGDLPAVPLVDYLQAIGVALEAYEPGNYEEAAAIILDVLDVASGYPGFPLAEINYLLGLCYQKMAMPKYAENYFREAIALRPDYEDAATELQQLGVAS